MVGKTAHGIDDASGDVALDSMLRKVARIDSCVPEALLPQLGQVVAGKYRVDACLGRGGMGAVFGATHVLTKKPVALKWMLRSNADEVARERFVREALAAGRIDHPNVVDVYDIGEQDGYAYLVMELLHGESLRERMARGPMAPAAVLAALLPAMRGVAAAHGAGVLHRDLKPDNIFLCTAPDGSSREAKVLDFGVASIVAGEPAAATLTQAGAVAGTPAYMSPEQLLGARDLDACTDVYAFGVILYEALAGRRPFEADSHAGLVVAVTQRAPIPPSHYCQLPRALEACVLRALAKSRAQRFQSMAELIAALEPLADATPTPYGVTEVAWASPAPSTAVTRSSVGPWHWGFAACCVVSAASLSAAAWLVEGAHEPAAVSGSVAPSTPRLPSDPEPYLPADAEGDGRAPVVADALPRSCEQARQGGRGSDALILIDPDASGPIPPFEVFCAGMGDAEPARAYLPLPQAAPDANFTRFVYGAGACHCPDLSARFARVRLDTAELSIDPADVTFATYDRSLRCEQQQRSACGESIQLSWGGAGSCVGAGDASGAASIDLRGTPFALAPGVRFVPAGFGASGKVQMSADRKQASLSGGGRCGKLVAERAKLALVVSP